MMEEHISSHMINYQVNLFPYKALIHLAFVSSQTLCMNLSNIRFDNMFLIIGGERGLGYLVASFFNAEQARRGSHSAPLLYKVVFKR